MKQEVVKFLANQPKNDSEKFNKAVSLYRQSKDNDPSLVRFMNAMGFSKDRLDNVLYELKKLHSITDLEIANGRTEKKENREEKEDDSTELSVTEDIEVNDAEDISTPLDVIEKATSEADQATEDASTELSVTEEFKKKLAGFDVEAEKYNIVKSFAADVSDVIKKDPKDQKGATLKAFILDAKKKFAEI